MIITQTKGPFLKFQTSKPSCDETILNKITSHIPSSKSKLPIDWKGDHDQVVKF